MKKLALILVLALTFVPTVRAEEDERREGQGPVGGICIQTLEGPTVCL